MPLSLIVSVLYEVISPFTVHSGPGGGGGTKGHIGAVEEIGIGKNVLLCI